MVGRFAAYSPIIVAMLPARTYFYANGERIEYAMHNACVKSMIQCRPPRGITMKTDGNEEA